MGTLESELLGAMREVQKALAADRDGTQYVHPEFGPLALEEVKYIVVDSVISLAEQMKVLPGTDVVDLLDDTSAALESVLAHYGNQMPAADLKSRTEVCQRARRFCDAELRPSV